MNTNNIIQTEGLVNSNNSNSENFLKEGIYSYSNNSFFIDSNIKIMVLKRKKDNKKTPLYLAGYVNKQFKYISSLYIQKQDKGKEVFVFDYSGKGYSLKIDTESHKISIKQA